MSDRGRDAPEDQEAYIPEISETEVTQKRRIYRKPFSPETDSETRAAKHFLQKRIFMSGRGRDTPEKQNANFPGRHDAEDIQEKRMYQHPILPEADFENVHASELKKLLSLRDRVRAIHEKIDDTIDKYRSDEGEHKNKMRGVDDQQWREWEKFLKGFETD